jgi:two-component system LytT family response regulator
MAKRTKCIIVDDEKIAREILESHLSKIDRIEIVASCKNVPEAYNATQKYNVDLIFLDINLPETSGLSFAKSMKNKAKVIFTTAYREYAVDGFDLQAVDYLLKPISFERLMQAVDKYLNEKQPIRKDQTIYNETVNDKFFFVRSERKMIKVSLDEILFVESLSDYVKIFMTDKTIITRETISHFEENLPTHDFIRTHRSYIVSISKIEAFTYEDLQVAKHEIPISRTYKKEVLEQLENRGLQHNSND